MFEPLQAQSALWFNPCNVTRQQRNIKYIDLNTIIKAKESNMLLLPCCRSELQDKSQEEQEAIAEETRKEEQRLAHVVGVSSADLVFLGAVKGCQFHRETDTVLGKCPPPSPLPPPPPPTHTPHRYRGTSHMQSPKVAIAEETRKEE
jgi:hypothetical protein